MPRKRDENQIVHYHYQAHSYSDKKTPGSFTEINQKTQTTEKKKLIKIPPVTEDNVKGNYPSRYNLAVWSYNHVTFEKHKKRMLSLSFLMYRLPFIIIFCMVWIVIVFSLWVPYLMILSILVSAFYFIFSLYNFIIFLVNGSIIDDPHLINDSHFRQFGERRSLDEITLIGEWITIDGDQNNFESDILPHIETINDLQEQHKNTGKIDILFYSLHYLEKFVHFPKEILIQGLIALITLLVGIIIPALVRCSWSKSSSKNGQICYVA